MLNVAVVMGRLVADPELRHTPSDVAVTSFTLAVDRSYRCKCLLVQHCCRQKVSAERRRKEI